MLQLSRMTKILLESRDAQFLSFFNHEAVEDMVSNYSRICETLDKEKLGLLEEKDKPMKQKHKTSYLICLTTLLKRIFRILLAYFNFRLCRIRREYWKTVANIPNDQLQLMDASEKEFYRGYDSLVKGKRAANARLPGVAAGRPGFAAGHGPAEESIY